MIIAKVLKTGDRIKFAGTGDEVFVVEALQRGGPYPALRLSVPEKKVKRVEVRWEAKEVLNDLPSFCPRCGKAWRLPSSLDAVGSSCACCGAMILSVELEP